MIDDVLNVLVHFKLLPFTVDLGSISRQVFQTIRVATATSVNLRFKRTLLIKFDFMVLYQFFRLG